MAHSHRASASAAKMDTTGFNGTIHTGAARVAAGKWLPDPFQAATLVAPLTLTLGVNEL